ncbi:MAG: T9SS type A sorting domain-containing protein, partial [Bacteroidetes bacterium]|nr:T9SS type A sorting domain-containing protein [Bacteroidota bacterium]
WPGGTTGCVIITGTPAIQDTGTYNLSITIDAYVGGLTTPTTTTLDAYSITILDSANCPATGLADIEFTKFAAVQTNPNPFTDKTEIIFSLPTASAVEFKVYNLLGKVVYMENIKAKAGVNTIEFISKGLPSGIYLYSLRNESNSVTRKMIISQY